MTEKQKQPRWVPNSKLCKESEDVDPAKLAQMALGGGNLAEGFPTFNRFSCEKVIDGKNNTWIVLGRDRPGGSISGNMLKPQSGAIDIVVGRMGKYVRKCLPNGEVAMCDPSFKMDAARVYISQQTSIDKNFSLAAGTIGSPGFEGDGKKVQEVTALSGIAVKADEVRIIGRRSIKLVTMGTDEQVSHGKEEVFPRSIQGINIIAGNRSTGGDFFMEPMPKGHRLSSALTRLSILVEDLIGIAHHALIFQDQTNSVLADHIHIWGDGKQPTSRNELLSQVAKQTVDAHADTSMKDYEELIKKLTKFRMNYCLESGDKYINSRWNFVN